MEIRSVDSTGNMSAEIPAALMWVKDAPLFIDKTNLDQFYDAVVRPPFNEKAPQTIRLTNSLKEDLEKKFGGKAGIHLPTWLSAIFSGGVEVSGEVKSGNSTSEATERTITLEPISTPHRQLEQLTVFYLLQQPQRLLTGGQEAPLEWQKEGICDQTPRALTFIDLPTGTKFIPMAAEFVNGKLVTFYDQLTAESGERPPRFDPTSQQKYWAWFDKNFDAGQSVEVIEKAATEYGKIEWIDFRVPLNESVDTMHLHIEAGGQYNTGTFAYRLVQRTVGHGIRVVGTMKDGPAFNVLALYEK
jgi:hypothetical protein